MATQITCYQCSSCDQKFYDKSEAEKHVKTHRDPIPKGRVFNSEFLDTSSSCKEMVEDDDAGEQFELSDKETLEITMESSPDTGGLNPSSQHGPELTASGVPLIRWTRGMVLGLVAAYKRHEDKFSNVSFTPKRIWNIIAEEINKKGHRVSGDQCSAKWRSLRKVYKKVKDHNLKYGKATRKWVHFALMHEVFSKSAATSQGSLEFNVPSPSATGDNMLTSTDFEDFGGSGQTDSAKCGKLIPEEEPEWFRKYREDNRRDKRLRHEERMKLKEAAERNKNKFRAELLNILKKTLQ